MQLNCRCCSFIFSQILRLGKQNQIDSMSVTEPSRSEFETRGATNSEMRIETYKSKS